MPRALNGLRDGAAAPGNQAYSDTNPPETLTMSEYATTVATPAAGRIVLYSPDGTTLLWKDDTGTVRAAGGASGTKISALPAATALGGTDTMMIVQGGVTKQIPASLVMPVPWVEVPLILATTAALTPVAASAAAGIELYSTSKTTRNKLDLSWASEVRLTALVINNGNVAGVNWQLQYATADTATWSGSTGVANAGVGLTLGAGTAGIMRDSGWQPLASGAKIDNCYVAMVNGTTAQGTTAPTIGSMSVFFR